MEKVNNIFFVRCAETDHVSIQMNVVAESTVEMKEKFRKTESDKIMNPKLSLELRSYYKVKTGFIDRISLSVGSIILFSHPDNFFFKYENIIIICSMHFYG